MTRILDTHCHVIDRSLLRYPWLASVPALDRDWPWALYQRQAAEAGITATLHMEVDVAAEDRAGEVAVATALPVVGVIAGCRPEAAGFAAEVGLLARDRRVRGVRRVLHTAPGALDDFARFAANLRALGPLGLRFDLCVFSHQLPVAARLIAAAPEVDFVLDHCGNAPIASGDLAAWRAGIDAVAALPNVVCKLSGIVTNCRPEWQIEDLRPAFEHVLARFGTERIVWGSDWPVCTLAASLAQWVEATHALLAGLGAAERDAIWAGNAARVYRV